MRASSEKKRTMCVIGTRGIPGIPGGVEKHCEQLYPLLAEKGFRIIVFARTPYVPPLQRIKEWKGVRIVYLWAPKTKTFEAFFHSLTAVFAARFYGGTIHIHAIGPSLVLPIAKILKLRIIATHHGPDYLRKKWGVLPRFFLKVGESFMIRCADQVIAISKNTYIMLKKRFDFPKITYIPNGYAPSKKIAPNRVIKDFSLEPGKYILSIGRFVPEKGFHDLLNAFKTFSTDWKLVICGDADHKTSYSKGLKKDARKITGIVLTGYITGKPLVELFSNAGMFILPSYYEGLPFALLEAVSYGLPVLVSDIPAHREVPLKDELYFVPGEIKDLAEKIRKIILDGSSEEEKRNIRRLLRAEYSWSTIAEKTAKMYTRVLFNYTL